MKLSRQTVKDIAEAIGFLAIIASLFFVAIETREAAEQTRLNTQALEISAYQALIGSISDMNALSIESESSALVMSRMRNGSPDDIEEHRVRSAFYITFRHGDIAYLMYEKGAIDEERLRSALRPLPLYADNGRAFWNQQKYNFVSGYQEYVDGLLAEGFWALD